MRGLLFAQGDGLAIDWNVGALKRSGTVSHSFYIGRFTDKRPEQRRKHRIGKYGRMRRAYLKEHRKILYTNYVVEGNAV